MGLVAGPEGVIGRRRAEHSPRTNPRVPEAARRDFLINITEGNHSPFFQRNT